MSQTWLPFILVGAGSMLGGISRFGLTLATRDMGLFVLPWGTLASNTLGCLLVGIVAGFGAKAELMSAETRLLLTTGFCGGFTTMSAFVYETSQLLQDKAYFFASGYFVLTLAGAGLAFLAGLLISQSIVN